MTNEKDFRLRRKEVRLYSPLMCRVLMVFERALRRDTPPDRPAGGIELEVSSRRGIEDDCRVVELSPKDGVSRTNALRF